MTKHGDGSYDLQQPHFMQSPEISECVRLTPCLLRAIEDHKYYRSCEGRTEVDFLEAAEDFHRNYEEAWRAAKVRRDNDEQLKEMHRHLWTQSQKAGHDLGRAIAAAEWISKYAVEWRRHRESLCANDFVLLEVRIQEGSMLSRGGLPDLVEEVARLSCDVFVHQEAVPRPQFCLEPEPGSPTMGFLVFRPRHVSELQRLVLSIGSGLRFIAYGRDAPAALERLERAARPPAAPG